MRIAVEFLYGSPFTLYSVVVLAAFSYIFLSFIYRRRYSHPLPPGPRGVPVLGYLPFLEPNLHSHFTKLAAVHGPVFRLQLGGKICIVVSSGSAAREVLRDQDATFANRDVPVAASVITYGGSGIAWNPYGPMLRMMKKVSSQDLLSGRTLDAFCDLRSREVRAMVARVARCAREGKAVDVGKEVFVTVTNVLIRMLWGGGGIAAGDGAEIADAEFKDLIGEIMKLAAIPNLSDFFPWLIRFDIQRLEKKMLVLRKRFDEIFERIIAARERNPGETRDFLDVLLQMEDKVIGDCQGPFTRDHTKGILMDLIGAGTDTTSNTVEFALAEMMNQPATIRQAQAELDEMVGRNTAVEESQAMQLQYLSAAIKEVLRLHSPVPLLLPRCPSADCVIGGYTVPAGSRVFVNAWAIHHDPSSWEDPLIFKPERFLDRDGGDRCSLNRDGLIYIPFGSGRRICVGSAMGERTMAYVLASLLQAFDWQLPDGENQVNLEEKFGLVLKLEKSLLLVAQPRMSNP